jgi:hypothetical protein
VRRNFNGDRGINFRGRRFFFGTTTPRILGKQRDMGQIAESLQFCEIYAAFCLERQERL